MANPRIRRAKRGDLKAIAGIVRNIWDHGGNALMEKRYGRIGGKPWQEWTAGEIVGELKKILPQVAVTEVNGEIVGFASYLLDRKKKVGMVGYNGVSNRFQGLGIGTRQLQWVLTQLRKKGMRYAQVITGLNRGHKPARRLYEKTGFVPLLKSITYTKRF